MRGPFLLLTPVCVFLGASTVVNSQASTDWRLLVLVLLGAVMAHISANTFNEYLDFKSGLDLTTTRTPFSGGSGALPRHPEMASAVLTAAVMSIVATLLIGLFLAWKYGPGIIPIGVVGLVLIVTYTGWINKHPFLCLIAPGTGFGFLMVVGTQFVLEGQYSMLSWIVAAVPFFLVNNLLLLNQYPDIQADADAGRIHLPIVYGTKISNTVYAFFVLAVILLITTCILFGYLPAMSLVALLPMPLAFFSLAGAIKHGVHIGNFPLYLAANAVVAILTPLLLGISLIIG
ncbi:MAG: prenyltransferase [Gammaproteobacteria bacterium]|nr:MAG: prenyltransferase [Gammaproteobacteria bacterium]